MTSSKPTPKGGIRNVPAPAGSKPSVYSRFIPREELSDFAAWNPGMLDTKGSTQQALGVQRPAPPAPAGAEPGGRAAGPAAGRPSAGLPGRLPRRPGRARGFQADPRPADEPADRCPGAVHRQPARRPAAGHGPRPGRVGHQPGAPDRAHRVEGPPRPDRDGGRRGTRHPAAECPPHHAAGAPRRPGPGGARRRRGADRPRRTGDRRQQCVTWRLPGRIRHRQHRRHDGNPLAPHLGRPGLRRRLGRPSANQPGDDAERSTAPAIDRRAP